MKRIIVILVLLFCLIMRSQNGQPNKEQIVETLMNYIEGTANCEPDKLTKAIHPNFNLYMVTQEGELRIHSEEKLISGFEKVKRTNRIGRIISIECENGAAIARAEIIVPDKRIHTDYFFC